MRFFQKAGKATACCLFSDRSAESRGAAPRWSFVETDTVSVLSALHLQVVRKLSLLHGKLLKWVCRRIKFKYIKVASGGQRTLSIVSKFGPSCQAVFLGFANIKKQCVDWVISQICSRIPRSVLEAAYGVTIPFIREYGIDYHIIPPPTAEEFLAAYASMFFPLKFFVPDQFVSTALRGFVTARGLPDISRVARHVLKDYVNVSLVSWRASMVFENFVLGKTDILSCSTWFISDGFFTLLGDHNTDERTFCGRKCWTRGGPQYSASFLLRFRKCPVFPETFLWNEHDLANNDRSSSDFLVQQIGASSLNIISARGVRGRPIFDLPCRLLSE